MYLYERLAEEQKANKIFFGADVVPDFKPDKRYIAVMGSTSHTYGNVLAFIQNWVLSLFPEDMFKTIHVNSKIAHRQIRSTTHEFIKKTKPMIIFRPRIAEHDEDRFFALGTE